MFRNKKISVIMPCRNEGAHLSIVVKRIPSFVDEIIIVSNKSTDNTVKVGRKLGLKVYEDNRSIKGIGYGYAHMTGIKMATGDIIAGIDGDATYPIEDLNLVINKLIGQKLDFISCNRYPAQESTKIPAKLRMGVWILNTETRLLYGVKINDILSGMWVFKKEVKSELSLTMGDWNLSPQIKINAICNKNIKFSEYSIAQHSREGESKQRYFTTGLSHFLWILKNKYEVSKNDITDKE
jgi:glycosyltransferase involved in cell wall biosynthesis